MALPSGKTLAILSRCRPVICYQHEMTFRTQREFRLHLREMHSDFC